MSVDFGLHITSFALTTTSFVAIVCDQDCTYFEANSPVDLIIATDTSTLGAQYPLVAGASLTIDAPPIVFPTFGAARYNNGDTLFFAKSKKNPGALFLKTTR